MNEQQDLPTPTKVELHRIKWAIGHYLASKQQPNFELADQLERLTHLIDSLMCPTVVTVVNHVLTKLIKEAT
jgi:dTDP-4-dehydrorhamnose reductase